jgi:uncharacterized protein (DUF1330 family)
MTAYVIVDIHITDPVQYEEYKKLAAPTVTAHGGKYIVRGGETERLEGERQSGRVVVLEFPSLERARAWWSSASYAPAKALRQASARTEMVLVDGV